MINLSKGAKQRNDLKTHLFAAYLLDLASSTLRPKVGTAKTESFLENANRERAWRSVQKKFTKEEVGLVLPNFCAHTSVQNGQA